MKWEKLLSYYHPFFRSINLSEAEHRLNRSQMTIFFYIQFTDAMIHNDDPTEIGLPLDRFRHEKRIKVLA